MHDVVNYLGHMIITAPFMRPSPYETSAVFQEIDLKSNWSIFIKLLLLLRLPGVRFYDLSNDFLVAIIYCKWNEIVF